MQQQEQQNNSCYSSDEEYFLDLCRAGEFEELKQFIQGLTIEHKFDWTCITNSQDNFLHMLAANNFPNIFDYLYPVVAKTLNLQQLELLINKQNATGNTPLHYAVITDSKEMVVKLLDVKANTNLTNQSNRTPFAEAEQFGKFQIAEILAPLTNNNLEELKKDMVALQVCNEDSDDEDEQGTQQKQQMEQEHEIE